MLCTVSARISGTMVVQCMWLNKVERESCKQLNQAVASQRGG